MIHTLQVFVTVIEQSHFSRAAEMLNMSQPSVSQHIRSLEQQLGAKLIQRSPKRVEVTEAGQILYTHAKPILAHFEQAKEEINQLQQIVTGCLKVGASYTIGEYVLPRLLTEYADMHPKVDIQVHIANTEDIVRNVRTKQLDIGLVEGDVPQPDLIVHTFSNDEMILVAPPNHPLAAQDSTDPQSLDDQIWILRESGSGTRAFSEQLIQQMDVKVKRTYIFSSSQSVKEAVMAGLGIAVLSRLIVKKELESGDLVPIAIQNQKLNRSFKIIYRKEQQPTRTMNMFIQALMQAK